MSEEYYKSCFAYCRDASGEKCDALDQLYCKENPDQKCRFFKTKEGRKKKIGR